MPRREEKPLTRLWTLLRRIGEKRTKRRTKKEEKNKTLPWCSTLYSNNAVVDAAVGVGASN
jgi:hypothetical protein